MARERRKRYYQLTPRGREMLLEEYGRLNRLVEEGREYLTDTEKNQAK